MMFSPYGDGPLPPTAMAELERKLKASKQTRNFLKIMDLDKKPKVRWFPTAARPPASSHTRLCLVCALLAVSPLRAPCLTLHSYSDRSTRYKALLYPFPSPRRRPRRLRRPNLWTPDPSRPAVQSPPSSNKTARCRARPGAACLPLRSLWPSLPPPADKGVFEPNSPAT